MPRNKIKSVGVLQIRYYPIEDKYLQQFIEAGYDISSLIRQWIREQGAEKFPEPPLYAQVQAEKLHLKKQSLEEKERIANMTEKEYAEQILRGRVVGDQVKFMIGTNMPPIYKPLLGIKNTTLENTPLLQNHIDILNRNFPLVDGSHPDYDQLIAEWETDQ